MLIRLRAVLEAFRDSLFFLPSLFVVIAVGLAELMLRVDDNVTQATLPVFVRFTVDSAREVLGTVAGATITVTGVVFALTALTVQLASTQYSPRVLRGFVRDRFNQAAIGFLVATFVYALLTLRSVRTALEDGGTEVVPNLSTSLAVVLAVAAVLVILAYVNHTAHALQASQLVRRVTDETVTTVRDLFPEAGSPGPPRPPAEIVPARSAHLVVAGGSGWVQQIGDGVLLEAVAPGGVVQVDVRAGIFVPEGTPLCRVWSDDDDTDELDERVRRAFRLGSARTMQQDAAFGIRQLTDIALRALSPGVNDPTTAYESIVHLVAVLVEILRRDLPPDVFTDDQGRWVFHLHELGHQAYVDSAFDQIRVAARPQPGILVALLNALGLLRRELERAGLHDRIAPLRRQAALVVAEADEADVLDADRQRVHRAAAENGFGQGDGGPEPPPSSAS